mmetsp:Transcript_26283/g.36626  ORF Transcript_26283/g.36626 Transcript_26283/m.36626 type:complete len:528 (+) Transcript_26283:65-1648(+)
MDSPEVPSKTFYYKALQRSFPKIFDKACQSCFTLLVPSLTSLPQKIDTDFVRAHILKPSPYFKDEFLTLDGKVVAIRGSDVVCRQGFRYPRNVKIINEETCYNENFESYRLLLTSAPLIGEIRTQRRVMKPQKKMAVARRSIKEHKKCIAAYLDIKCIEAMTRSMQVFVNHFRQNYVIVKGFVDDAARKCKNEPKASLENVLRERRNNKGYPPELLIACEALILNALHSKIFNGLCTLYKDEDLSLYRCNEALTKNKDFREKLGVRKDLVINPQPSIDRLKELNSHCTLPLAKLCCLYDVQELISANVYKASNPGEREVLAADDVLPIVAYVIALAGDQFWCSNLEYLKHFSPESKTLSSIDAGSLGYQLANFQAAIDLLRDLGSEIEKKQLEPSLDSLSLGSAGEPSPTGSTAQQGLASDSSSPPEILSSSGRRSSSIREGSSARARALRRLQKQELARKKVVDKPKRHKYKDEIDRALRQIGLSVEKSDGIEDSRKTLHEKSSGSLVHSLLAREEKVLAGQNSKH